MVPESLDATMTPRTQVRGPTGTGDQIAQARFQDTSPQREAKLDEPEEAERPTKGARFTEVARDSGDAPRYEERPPGRGEEDVKRFKVGTIRDLPLKAPTQKTVGGITRENFAVLGEAA